MKINSILRAPEGDVGGSGGGTASPAQPTTQNNTGPSETATNVWGGRSAPDWIKSAGLGATHDKTNVGEPKTDDRTTPNAPDIVAPKADPVVEPTVQPAVQQQPAVQAPAAITADTIAQAFAKVFPQQQGQQPSAQPQMTEAQLREQLGIFTADETAYEAAFGVKPDSPQRLAAYNQHLQNIARQAVTVSQVLMQRAMEQQQAAVQPYIAAVRAQEAEKQRNVFFKENTDLAGYDALVEKEYQQAMQSGQRFETVDQARKFIADRTRETLRRIGITPASAGRTQPTTTTPAPQPAARKMTTTSVGGRSGGSAMAGKAASSIEAVWGKK